VKIDVHTGTKDVFAIREKMIAAETVEVIRATAEEDKYKVEDSQGCFRASGGPETDFDAIFGRDGLISIKSRLHSARRSPDQLELFNPVRKTLLTLALFQGKEINPARDEEPGKIPHELRFPDSEKNIEILERMKGEGWPVVKDLHYFGSVDSTPLFVDATCEYFLETEDLEFFRKLEPNVRAAICHMEEFGDMLGDGYIRFSARNRNALLNQGWMDSFDSLEIEPGVRPKEPIALVEVQAYAYSAYVNAGEAYRRIGDYGLSKELFQKAGLIKSRFNDDFWMEDEQYFACALDVDNKQVREIRSNPGHAILTGIIGHEKLPKIVDRLMQPDMFTPHGIRTLSRLSKFFSYTPPKGYHNGSIWPHDNGFIYLGLKKMGFLKEAIAVRDALLSAQHSLLRDFNIRNPELYTADFDDNLLPYDTAQHPQTWVREINAIWTNPREQEELLTAS